nr:retrovirus-related Pol polyprotein from transposon TNT 1-94 [Tanacetum cinerariifolium]
MVTSCLKKLKFHLASFDIVVKERTTVTAIMEGTWGFEHTKACFRDDIILFVKALKELFTLFDQCLIDEVTEVQNVFKQMELAVKQHREEKNKFQNKMENVLQENDQLLTQALSVEIVNVAVHDNVKSACLNMDVCAHCVTIESELKMIFSKMILKLKEKLRSLNGDVNERNVKRELEEIETLNIELDHKVTKLVAENEHLKQTYRQLYDSIKSSRVRSKEQCDDLINKVNLKSAEVSDLNASLQEKVLVITALKEQLNKLKGKAVLTEAVSLNPIDPELIKVNVAPLGLVRGLPKLKFKKDHLCSACAMGKSTKKTHKPQSEDTNQEKLYLLHMDLYGPMRVESVNGKKYILVIVDDYSRFTWVKFLRSKDETPDFIIKFLKMIQVRLNVPVRRIRTDNETEFVNQTLRDYYEEVGISHETSVARFPQQNGVVERCNQAVATACFTQNQSIIRLRHGKTPYELLHSKLSDLSFFYVFGALCYPTNDSENLDKLQPKVDIGIFIGYAPLKKAFRIYNQRTRRIVETIHDLLFQPMFDELLNPSTSVVNQAPEVIAPIAEVIPPVHADLASSPSSTMVDQDAPSLSKTHTTTEIQSSVIPQDVRDDNLDMEVAHMGNDLLFGVPIP